jgi:hypothetical protein
MTRMKFRCISVTKTCGWASESAFFYLAKLALVQKAPEVRPEVTPEANPHNTKLVCAMTHGTIEAETVNENDFQVGKDYYVDFTPCEDD